MTGYAAIEAIFDPDCTASTLGMVYALGIFAVSRTTAAGNQAFATALSNFAFEFFSGSSNELVLNTFGADNASGILLLQPGSIPIGGGLRASGEFTPPMIGGSTGTRLISAGSLVAAEVPAAVPEASTTVSFGLLLALGLGGMVVAAKRKKGAAQA